MITADLDGDGDLDLVSASFDDDRVAWYESGGDDVFTPAIDITTTADGVSSVIAADLDRDGDLDLASANYIDDSIGLYLNDGQGMFTATDDAIDVTGVVSLVAADLDGDGDLDLASASFDFTDSSIAWFSNDGNGTFSPATDITTPGEGGTQAVIAADLDGDGDLDLASASRFDGTVVWYANDGAGTFTASEVSTTALGAESVIAADLDGDGDLDLASAAGDRLVWYAGDGTGTFSAGTDITTAAERPSRSSLLIWIVMGTSTWPPPARRVIAWTGTRTTGPARSPAGPPSPPPRTVPSP